MKVIEIAGLRLRVVEDPSVPEGEFRIFTEREQADLAARFEVAVDRAFGGEAWTVPGTGVVLRRRRP